jgi:hypothetical protein
MASLIDTTISGNLDVDGNVSANTIQINDSELETLVAQLDAI